MRSYAQQIKNVKDYIRLPFVYNHWYMAGYASEFDRSLKEKTLLNRSIVFFRTESGEVKAFQNRCLHRSFPLSSGFLEGDEVVCGYHGIRYNPDGVINRIPCQEQSSNRKLKTYPLMEIGPFVFIWMGDGEADKTKFPDLGFLTDPHYRTIYDFMEMKGNYLLMQDNLNDLSHFAYLHRESFGLDDGFLELPVDVQQKEGSVWCNRIDRDPNRSIGFLPPYIQDQVRGKPSERWDAGITRTPGIFQGYAPIFVGEEGDDNRQVFKQHIMHYLTPETETTTHYWWSVSNDFAIEDDQYYDIIFKRLKMGFDEDKVAVGKMQQLLDNDHINFEEMIIAGDKAGLLFRKVMLGWVQDEYGEHETS